MENLYVFYKSEFGGTLIPDVNAFSRIVLFSKPYVDRFVLCRDNIDLPEVTRRYNTAICAVSDLICQKEIDQAIPVKSSETVGPHSVTYAVKQKTAQEYENEKAAAVKLLLSGTGLLYGGMG